MFTFSQIYICIYIYIGIVSDRLWDPEIQGTAQVGAGFDPSGPYYQSNNCLIQGTFISELLDLRLRKVTVELLTGLPLRSQVAPSSRDRRIYMYVSLSLFLSPSLSIYLCIYIYVSRCLSLYIYIYIHMCFSLSLSLSLSLYIYIYVSRYRCVYIYIYTYVFLSLSFALSLYIYVSIYIYIDMYLSLSLFLFSECPYHLLGLGRS